MLAVLDANRSWTLGVPESRTGAASGGVTNASRFGFVCSAFDVIADSLCVRWSVNVWVACEDWSNESVPATSAVAGPSRSVTSCVPAEGQVVSVVQVPSGRWMSAMGSLMIPFWMP